MQFISFSVPPMEASAKLVYVRRDPSLRIMINIYIIKDIVMKCNQFSLKSHRDWERPEAQPQSEPEKPSNICRQPYTKNTFNILLLYSMEI